MGQRRVGIMGGTFDPVHHGHLIAAAEARQQLGLDEVMFVPTGRPWQKPEGVSDAEDRYLMTVIATASNPAFTVSRIEIDTPGPTYTVDTLRRLRAQDERARLFFIAGADAAAHLTTWKDPAMLLELAELVVVSRPGTDLSELHAAIPDAAERVHVLRIPELAISSTDLRSRVAGGIPVDYLAPPGVASYIAKRGLYRGGEAAARMRHATPGHSSHDAMRRR